MTPQLQEKLAQLREYVTELEDKLAPSAHEDERLFERALERYVQLLVECAADAGDLWLEQHGLPPGDSAANVFHRLHEAGAINREVHALLRGQVSTRNRIVHDYDHVSRADVRRAAEALAAGVPRLLAALGA